MKNQNLFVENIFFGFWMYNMPKPGQDCSAKPQEL